jgi:aryl-alcohol dehydrogenase-like predicted oxidoreductase
MEALDRLVRDGKVREIGCSNFTGAMIDAAQGASATHGWARFASVQSQMNLLDSPPDGTLESCERYGMKLIPYFPLASGLLTGKYKRNAPLPAGSRFGAETKVTQTLQDIQINDARLAKVEELSAFAASGGHTILELAISWLTSQPVVASVICGATKPEQIEANARAAEWELTAEDFRDVATILDREPA